MDQEKIADLHARMASDQVSNFGLAFSSILAILFTIFLGAWVFENGTLIDMSNWGGTLRSLLILLGCTFFVNTLIALPILFLRFKSEWVFLQFDNLMRASLIVAGLITSMMNIDGVTQFFGGIGIVLMISLYVVYGVWFFSPGDAFNYFILQRFETLGAMSHN